ncbi:B-cell receptor CD22-like [Clarias gariepinus]|uniref:B-cell receptor CD22-like n=1 Tax=Clarias gariepinus TaxID=13013 RepID=UPI00234E0117|nr:B-cell receptor CD22-like [Clarias gariepinus]
MDRFGTLKLFIAASLLVGVCHCWWVSVDSVNAVRGSCVLVPCRTAAYSKVAWYKYARWGYPTVYSNERSEILSEFSGRTSVPGSRYSGDCSLRINNVQDSDSEEGLYVWVWDRDGYNQGFYEDHQIINIYVWDPTEPEISVESKQVEGKPFTATCKFRHSCRSSPPRIYWYGASPISNAFTNTKDWEEFWESQATATFNVTQDTSLRCKSSLSGTSYWSTSVYINVLYAPRNVRIEYTRRSPVVEGDKISLQCTSNSNPTVTAYEWVVIQNTTTTRYRENPLVLQNVRRDTSVSCSATNSVGTGRSQQLSLSVNYAPTDVTVDYTGSSSVVEGGQISFTCTSISSPAPTHYKWLVSPNSITYSPSGSTVVLQNVTGDTSVSCIATNSIGQGESKQLSLNIHYAPTDVTVDYTGSSSVVEGGQISLTCTSISSPAPTHYKWLVSPNSITYSPSGSTVVLQNVTRDTSVSCIATNSIGQGESKQLSLNVHSHRDVEVDSTPNSPVVEGNKISLQCTIKDHLGSTDYEWLVSQNTTTTRYKGSNLVLENVSRDNRFLHRYQFQQLLISIYLTNGGDKEETNESHEEDK